ncbi:UL36 very large tegument protein [Streptomyces tanashiensis]|uniref:UL36 very large tegument protein n=1 Tax=Streptomyces tanashiensis TaxID=67367 RepID=A0ABY6QUB1_9ACTN|nr:UL36 very large tegument protein [Streptomyces tanashiensis]UZX20776.1 UL36 very large tegument protein [Streptomyces tanashiensis]
MTVYQLPVEVATFRHWLTELVRRVRPDGGWYGVFAARDPEGLRACFDGIEILPWDVVESLLQDAGEAADGPFAARGRALYAAAAAAHDRRPGGAAALAERRDLMEGERRYAESRTRELGERLRAAPDPAEASRLERDLAWTRDDHARATSRVRELTSRLARLVPPGTSARDAGAPTGGTAPVRPTPSARTVAPVAAAPASAYTAAPVAGRPAPVRASGPAVGASVGGAAPAKVKRRPRGARYAWLEESADEPAPLPALPTGGAAPRGARFGGVEPVVVAEAPVADPAEADRAAANAVYALRRLRAQGRSGEAHALLCEALGGPPARLPALAAELHRAGLGADWSTLLWEAASLPPGRLAAVAGVLADAGRTDDCEQLLRQGVARPVEELAGACAALHAEDHHREAHALLTAFVRVRAPEDAARLAGADPHGLVPQLLAAARAVSASRERDLLHALRVAGLAGA